MGMRRNVKSPVGIPWEWELVAKLGMGMGRNGNVKSHSRSSLVLSDTVYVISGTAFSGNACNKKVNLYRKNPYMKKTFLM